MEIPSRKETFFDEEFVAWLLLFEDAAEAVRKCQEADPSETLPSECKRESAQFLAWKFGQIVASYALRDEQWRDNLFCEGEFIINPWDDIWGHTDEKGAPDRLIPLVVGSLLSDYDNSRDWKALREHYVQMWSGSYTSYGGSLSEVGPQDDLYWAMRIGFAEKMLEQPQPAGQQTYVHSESSATKETLTNISLRLVKMENQNRRRFDELFEALPPTSQKIRSRLQHQIGSVAGVLPNQVFSHCVEAERYYENGSIAPAILSFAKAVEACISYRLVNPLIDYMQRRKQEYMTVCFPPPRGSEKNPVGALRRLSLAEWAGILNTLSEPGGKSFSTLGILDLRKFMEEHVGGQRLPDFRPLVEPLRKIQRYRNNAAHDSPSWEDPQQDLEETRALVLGIGEQTSVIVEILRRLAPRTPPDLASPDQALSE